MESKQIKTYCDGNWSHPSTDNRCCCRVNKGSTSVRQVGDEEEEEVLSNTDKVLAGLVQAMQQLAEKVGALQEQPRRVNRKDTPGNQRLCWECGKEGHLRRNCPNQKSSSLPVTPAQGNGQGPQQ